MHLASLLVIATAFWGQTPACGQPTISVEPLPAPIIGLADYGPCAITLDRRNYPAGQACMVTLHEYGHLLGLGHFPDPTNVMYPVVQAPRWPCAW